MKKKLVLKMLVDLVLTICFVVAMGYYVTTLKIHELVGVVFTGFMVFHMFLGAKWFVQLCKRKQGKIPLIMHIRTVSTILVMIDLVVLSLSGILISRTLFIFLSIGNTALWTWIHKVSAYGGIILIGIHMGMYWNIVMAFFRKLFGITCASTFRTILLRLVALFMAILGVKASFDRGLAAKFVFTTMELNSGFGEELTVSNKSSKETLTANQFGGGKGNKPNKGQGHGNGEESSQRSFADTPVVEGETENDYLGRLTCTACGKHCSLLTPQCNRGELQAQQAIETYNSQSESEQSASDVENQLTVGIDVDEDTLLAVFTDYVPIMGLYIAGTYYTLQFVQSSNCKKRVLQIEDKMIK